MLLDSEAVVRRAAAAVLEQTAAADTAVAGRFAPNHHSGAIGSRKTIAPAVDPRHSERPDQGG